MGLDFRGWNIHWSYSGFHTFRLKLANEIGVELEQMEGFGPFESLDGPRKFANISWDTVQDPIKWLLSHSDCDGILEPDKCAEVAPRLRFLVETWSEIDYDKRTALKLADAMEKCAKRGEPLEFA